MPEAARDTVYIGQANPPGWGERARLAEASAKRAGRFVKEKIIDPHTPQAHTQESMRFFDEATSHLYGRSREIADALRPKVEVLATIGGWSKTMMELCLAGTAVGVSAVLVGKGVKSTAEVFQKLARRHTDRKRIGLPTGEVHASIGSTLLSGQAQDYLRAYDVLKKQGMQLPQREELLGVIGRMQSHSLPEKDARRAMRYQQIVNLKVRRSLMGELFSDAYDRLFPNDESQTDASQRTKGRILEGIEVLEFARQHPGSKRGADFEDTPRPIFLQDIPLEERLSLDQYDFGDRGGSEGEEIDKTPGRKRGHPVLRPASTPVRPPFPEPSPSTADNAPSGSG